MTAAPTIILLHGLARSQLDMRLMAYRFRALLPESRVHCFDYPSRKMTLTEATESLRDYVHSVVEDGAVSFVGHSLGGIVARNLDLTSGCKRPLHRLVTLGSPHNGAVIARVLSRYSAPKAVFGPMLTELGELRLPEQPRELAIGCLVGGTNSRFGFLPLFGSDNDGTVLTTEAALHGTVVHDVVPILHALFPFSAQAATLTAKFLRDGAF
jgi:pimeloyl-ACP methyl ester carboxylesterase